MSLNHLASLSLIMTDYFYKEWFTLGTEKVIVLILYRKPLIMQSILGSLKVTYNYL